MTHHVPRNEVLTVRRTWTRRQFLSFAVTALAGGCARVRVGKNEPILASIEANVGGRVGVFAVDTGNGRQVAYRADERFAMCSTFKWVLAAAVLEQIDHGKISLDGRLPYGPSDLLDYAPATRAHVAEGFMTVSALAQAAVTLSDNTAANLLLAKLGGPGRPTEFARSLGDMVTRLDRTEPSLNSNEPGDPRDTTSPRAMVGTMRRVLCGNVLSTDHREQLLAWLHASETGKDRLRAGLPRDWSVGDKTGTGQRGAANDIAIAQPPGRAPILIAAYLSDGTAAPSDLAKAHAAIGRLVAERFAS